MASNGKVAVDKLKIGATVSIKLKDSGSCEGAVYTVDPVTKTVVLFSAAEKPVTQDSRDVRLVPEHAIDSIKVVKQPDAKDKKALVAPLPAIDVAACKKRESEAYEAMEAAMAMLNPNASAAGQAAATASSPAESAALFFPEDRRFQLKMFDQPPAYSRLVGLNRPRFLH